MNFQRFVNPAQKIKKQFVNSWLEKLCLSGIWNKELDKFENNRDKLSETSCLSAFVAKNKINSYEKNILLHCTCNFNTTQCFSTICRIR